jgi:hypothetical protein
MATKRDIKPRSKRREEQAVTTPADKAKVGHPLASPNREAIRLNMKHHCPLCQMTPSKPIYTKEDICDGMLRSVGVTKINVGATVSKNIGKIGGGCRKGSQRPFS